MFSGTSTSNFGGGTPALSLPAVGNTASAPVSSFGTTPAFGTTSAFAGTSIFGQKPASNANTPAFGTTPAFATPTTPVFGSQPNTGFGSQPNTLFGSQPNTGFGSQPTAGFGSQQNTGFGGGFGNLGFGATHAASTTAPPFGAQPLSSRFGQPNSGFGNNPFSSNPAPFGFQSSSISMQTTTPSTFGTPGFGQPSRGGSRAVPFAPTNTEELLGGKTEIHKFQSISCMPVYAEKSHEELRWEDYQLGDKGGQITQPNSFTSTTTNPNPFSLGLQKTTTFTGFNTSGTAGSTPSNPFATGTSLTSTNAFNQPSITPASTPYNFGTTPSFTTTPAFTFGTTPSTATSPFNSIPGAANPFVTPSAFQQPNTAFAPVSTRSAPLTSTVGTQNSSVWNNTFNSTPAWNSTSIGQTNASQQTTPAFSFQQQGQTNPAQQTPPAFNFPSSGFQQQGQTNQSQQTPAPAFNFPSSSFQQQGQTNPSQQTLPAFNFHSSGFQQQQTSSGFGQNTFPQLSTGNQSNPPATQPSGVTMNPFGTLPAMPQISIGHTRAAPSIQYGISRMPVVEKAEPVRVSPLLMTSRHLSQNRIRLPARRSANNKSSRVPFFGDDEEPPSTPKADALFIPRENPRALVIRPLEHWTSRVSAEKSKNTNNTPLHENGKVSEKDLGSSLNGSINHENHKSNPSLAENSNDKERTVNENGADIEALMPKLHYCDYYTEPEIQELAAKERAEPGFCGKVKDFIVGRHGLRSIKFAGETDVRNLDLESLVQFNNREVIVYLDDSKKPPVGQGLNKAAVVTLLNIKCFDKKTGQQYLEGVKVEKFKELLMKKTVDQGAEFVSYDPIKGEWKFRVNHF
ncbi:nuclear pore complex protein NUP98A-like [Papaver somniferum]|uniref:nuclear pore complex protein NUP98A-like n=1 Tax=Papaver somniferum TaxID=3469 RepID=UPI000E6F9B1C|nr:nuclear pore complex protein NUP98A-like [Papaver somniferum]XP_026408910.1 nuclear pore complex protein NUP98A-like [Papaver somniferum]XP_026408911.1 nuclear pore complex protein NUP98A-like [Papaver somniferum]XP_026408912.1 nuclear pore complex protein NUP98A-like [Papaver somniferum]XP_026408913.1 nuclear pore complex protein NUP98A-like [Papaver somniferum]XP_026408914.1 nuclear pore complex protein NUP98A-like [Papaver somniferum]